MSTPHQIIRDTSLLFMLPLELRLHIYRYLVPNCLQENERTIMKATRYGDRCYPLFLAVNKQMYREGIPEFYGSIFYEASIHPWGLYIHGNKFCLRDPPHASLQYISKLDLSIRLATGFPADTDYSLNGQNPGDRPQYDYGPLLNAIFGPNGSSRLRKLRCTVEVDYDVYMQLEKRTEDIPKILDQQLAQLKGMRGLSEVTVTARNNCATLYPGWEEIFSCIDAYVNTMDKMLPRTVIACKSLIHLHAAQEIKDEVSVGLRARHWLKRLIWRISK